MAGMPMPGWPGMFPMPLGGKGFPFPAMMSGDMAWPTSMWEAHKQWGAFGMPFPGVGAKGDWNLNGPRDGRRSRSRRRSRGRSRSDDNREGKTSDRMTLPRQIMGRVIGKHGATIKDIREQSGARIDAEDVSNDQCEFKITGKPEEVEKAKKLIREIVDKTAIGPIVDTNSANDGPNVTSEIVEFPASVTGRIIGSKGVKIAEVRHSSGAKVQVEKGEEKCKVHMTGTPEQLDRARAMVTKLAEEAEELNKPIEDGVDAVNDFLEFPMNATGSIIGSRGAKIAEVRQQSGAKVQVEKLEDRCKVLLSGTPDAIERAKVMVRRLVEEGQDRQAAAAKSRRGDMVENMDVPQSLVGRVIGKGGETIQRIQRESGARLDVNTQSGDPCSVRIAGDQESVCHARFMISEIIDKGGLRSDAGSSQAPSGYWPESGYPPFGGPPPPGPPGYPGDYGEWMGMWGPMGGKGVPGWDFPGAPGGAPPAIRDIEVSHRNEIDMDDL